LSECNENDLEQLPTGNDMTGAMPKGNEISLSLLSEGLVTS
jgi:hypothetical protein